MRPQLTSDADVPSVKVLVKKHKLWEENILREGIARGRKAARHCGHFPPHLLAEEEKEAQG